LYKAIILAEGWNCQGIDFKLILGIRKFENHLDSADVIRELFHFEPLEGIASPLTGLAMTHHFDLSSKGSIASQVVERGVNVGYSPFGTTQKKLRL